MTRLTPSVAGDAHLFEAAPLHPADALGAGLEGGDRAGDPHLRLEGEEEDISCELKYIMLT